MPFRTKRIVSILFSNCVVFNLFCNYFCCKSFAASVMTVERAAKLAIANDSTLNSINTKMSFQYIKRKQAQEAIADIRKKERTVRFSLLFNIKLPEKHGLPKEVDSLTKLPQIDAETALLEQKAKNRQLMVREKVETRMIKIYCLQESITAAEENLKLAEQNLKKFQLGVLSGVVSSQDLKSAKESCADIKKELTSLKQSFATETTAFSKMLGIDVSNACKFKNPLSTVTIPREKVKDMIDYAMHNRYDVYQVESMRKIACRKVDTIFEIYKSQHGSKAIPLENEVRSEGKVDYNNFLRKYESYLTEVDKPWAKVYKIKLLFFTIKIPKEWFKGEYSGTRYFEDEKYKLPEAMRERDDARKEESITKEDVKASLEEQYEALMVAERAYRDAVEACDKLKATYEEVKIKNLFKTATYEETHSAKDDYDMAQKEVRSTLESLNNLLAVLDRDTCGWVSQYKKGQDILNVNTTAGDSLGVPKPHYLVQNNIEDLQSVFTLTIPEESKISATDYELWVDDLRVGQRQAIDKPLIVLPIEITGLKTVTVKLYRDNEFVDEAEFDGLETSGDLDFKVQAAKNNLAAQAAENELKKSLLAEETEEVKKIGSYLLDEFDNINGLTLDRFSVKDVPNNVAFFKVYVTNGDETGYFTDDNMTPIGKEVLKLDVMFNDISKIRVVLYDSNKTELFRTRLDSVNKTLIQI